jgi:6,7-dimethyl-8-ribityllumazine synthase
MATEGKNLSKYELLELDNPSSFRFGIAVSKWNNQITDSLLKGALEVLEAHKIPIENIIVQYVPGSFELPTVAQWLIVEQEVDAVVCLGSVIRGETAHFDFVCQGVSQGIKDVSLKTGKAVIFGVLTDDNLQQSIDRSGGKHGNKGAEAAAAAIEMAVIERKLKA